jgi:CrcB protein
MRLYLLIALGGALGSVARAFISNQFPATFPWGTLVVNVTGSFIIGFFFTLTEPGGRVFVSGNTRAFFMTGVCGGYTTFSSFSLNTLNLAREGEWLRAGANTVASVVACLVAVWLGHLCAALVNQMKGS